MRLLHSATLELHEFIDNETPDYAILSHRWGSPADEVSFLDFQTGRARLKRGFDKLTHTCALARARKIDFVWIDTCCIDKSSSAELSEAINSMFRYYENSEVCFAYLADVDSSKPDHWDLYSSSWFTRSWTLQELLAPMEVEFFDGQWRHFGSKESLADELTRITLIDPSMLVNHSPSAAVALRRFSIATKMSWAAKRVASRVEDIAYSLLGIFEVNMPLLYGEGMRAFNRLQEEIMKHSDDHTLFAWSSDLESQRGLLSHSPLDFAGCGNVTTVPKHRYLHRRPYNVTNMGLSIELMIPWAMDVYLAALDATSSSGRIGIFLHHLDEEGQYVRVSLNGKDVAPFSDHQVMEAQVRRAYVRQSAWFEPYQEKLYGFCIRSLPETHKIAQIYTSWKHDASQLPLFLELAPGAKETVGVVWFKSDAFQSHSVLKLAFDDEFNIKVLTEGPLFTGKVPKDALQKRHNSPPEDVRDKSWTKDSPQSPNPFLEHIPRILGAAVHRPSAVVSIWEELVAGRRTWVVDITETQTLNAQRAINLFAELKMTEQMEFQRNYGPAGW